MESPPQKYELMQNGKKYNLTTQISGEYIILKCIERDAINPPIFIGKFSLSQLRQLSSLFNSLSDLSQALNLLNQTIENQKVSIEYKGQLINVILFLTSETESEDEFSIKFDLNMQTNDPIYNKPIIYQSFSNGTTAPTLELPVKYLPDSVVNVSENSNLPQDIFSNPISSTTNTTGQEIYSSPLNLNPTENIFSESIENNITEKQNLFSNPTTPVESNLTQNIYSNTNTIDLKNIIPQDILSNETTTQDIFSNDITTQNIFSSPVETNIQNINLNPIDSTVTQDIFSATINNDYQNINNENIQNTENYQNYNIGNQVQTIRASTKKIEKLTLPLSPSRIIETQNNNLNEALYDQKLNEIPYIGPIEEQTNINVSPPLIPPKREEIKYVIPGSPSTGQFFYSAVPSIKNPEYFNQKTVETTTTTTNYSTPFSVEENEKIIQLQNETSKIKGDYNNLKNEANKLNEEVNLLRNQIEVLSNENSTLREKSGTKPNDDQIHEITILKQENEELKRQLEQYLNNINNLEKIKILKEDENSLLKSQIQELLKNQKRLEEIILEKQKVNEELKLQIKQLINKLNISESQNNIIRQTQRVRNSLDNQTLTIHDSHLEVIKGDIIKSTSELEFLTRKICRNYKKITLDLLYKASIDGDKAESFHNKCDIANSSLVLIKTSDGKRFGGYTTCNWKGNSIEKKDEFAFVFSLDKMKIYDIIPGENAIGCYPKYGPVFLGCQIRVYDECFKNGGTTFEKGLNYNTEEDFELSGGKQKYNIKEVEVYSIELE
jgi:predicted  nucleic acid-binding Zn-ribbon protein